MPRVRLRQPHAVQERILREARRFNVLAMGRRAGKSALGEHVLALAAIKGDPVAYFAPTYKLLAEFWRELRATLEPITRSKSEQDHRLELISGGTVECWSLDDPNPARGRKYRLVVVDEAAMVKELLDIWQLALRPTLADLAGGAWFMSTPQGLNAFHTLWLAGQSDQGEWKSWQMPTSVNPFIRPSEIEAARLELPERAFAQEFEARFLSMEGAGVFRGVHAVSRLQPEPPVPGHHYVFGVDWGRSNDFTVISIIDASVNEQAAMDRFTQIDYEFQSERLHRWVEAYRPRAIVAEANSMGGPLVERLQTGYARLLGAPRPALPIIPWTASIGSKAAAIQALSLAIENGTLTLLEDPVQSGELLAYESSRTVTGMLRYGAPEGGHDDTVTALSLAWLGSITPQETSRQRYEFGDRARRARVSA